MSTRTDHPVLYVFRLLAIMLLLMVVAILGFFGIKQMGLPKYVVSALAAAIMLGVMGIFSVVLAEENKHVEDEEGCHAESARQHGEPERHFS